FIYSGLSATPGAQASFDPTGKKLAYVGSKGQTIETINADGSGHQVVPRGSVGAGSCFHPVFSPDGKRIAFAQTAALNLDLYVKNLSDGSVKRLTTNAADDLNPTWSSDGSKIAFTSQRSGHKQIWVVPSNGGTQVRITQTSVTEDFAS